MLSSVSCVALLSEQEKVKASELVFKKYNEQGYLEEGDENIIATFLNEQNSVTFGALVKDEMYGTISVVKESDKGFPMESLYKDEVEQLRKSVGVLAEVVQFAVDQDVVKKHLRFIEASLAAIPLFAATMSCAEHYGVDALCISVNPKHVSLYATMGFVRFGDEKHYSSVTAPAIPMVLVLKDADQTFFGESVIGRLVKKFALPYPSSYRF